MTETITKNTAERGSTVGIQAEQVHNSTVYQVFYDTSPAQLYETGRRFLADGVPARARELIGNAISRGHENSEVRFYWALAMLSKRAYRDLSLQERNQLGRLPEFLARYADDDWKRALEAIHDLLERLHGSRGDLGPALNAIQGLDKLQRDQIVLHLDLVLTGSAKDKLWAEAQEAARAAQLSNDRVNRVWAYFQPKPAEAKARKPVPVDISPSNRGQAVMWTALSLGAAWYLGSTVLRVGPPVLAVAIFVALLGSGFVCFRNGLEWQYRSDRLRSKERDYARRYWDDVDREGQFARDVDTSFTYYFAKYVPPKMERDVWLAATAGIRATLRDEIVELYKEEITSRYGDTEHRVGHVEWLIRYLVREVTNRRRTGTLRTYREEWRTGRLTKVLFLLSLPVVLAMLAAVAYIAVPPAPVVGGVAVAVLVLSGQAAMVRWSRVFSERRRFADDHAEYEGTLADRQTEHERWVNKLNSTLPSESEMEMWLTCDKTILLDDALRHYKVAWQDVIAHAFLQTPARRYKRARMLGCPWRYSNYDMRLFLITHDGVREYRAEFNFEHALITRNERNNFRFDAVSSIGVIKTNELNYTLKLRLNNGPPSRIRIVEAARTQPDTENKKEEFSEINLDAAGFKPTLHILEGIAAEGKGWIERDPQTGGADGPPTDIF